jgi:hypothetical protein|tara:strand:+ start:1569 stop:1817 length:249 start_codon:yes stop_codon:yes gene_type:complete
MTYPDDFKPLIGEEEFNKRHDKALRNADPSYKKKKTKPKIDKTAKIYERNWSTGEIRWRYCGESIDDFTWPNYGRKLKKSEY